MKISFLIPAVVLYVVEIAFSNSLQVGTVLFTTTDLVKKCWTENDKSLLKARLIMQDVLPDPDCIDFSKPEAPVVLLDYFHACYQIISTSTYGKLQNLMYIALSDALGGYLRAYVLPFARRAYYAGQLQYSEAKKLFQLYDDIRVFLKTSGLGWAEPVKVCYKKIRAKPLTITGGSLEACNQLFMIEKEKLHCINPSNRNLCLKDKFPKSPTCKFRLGNSQQGVKPKNKKTSFHPGNSSTSDCTARLRSSSDSTLPTNFTKRCICCRKNVRFDSKRVIIPLPVLDDCGMPHTIAVPFRKRPLRNLSSRSSAFILEFYYVAVVKCFIAKGNARSDIQNFNSQFHSWLVTQVFPHLGDEKWYPGFGGVLRVMETIRKFGAETTAQDPQQRDISFMFAQGVSFDTNTKLKMPGKEIMSCNECDYSTYRRYITIGLVASLACVFIFFTCRFLCKAIRKRKNRPKDTSNSEEKPKEKNKSVNFQFLIKFFKKNEAQKQEQTVQSALQEEKERYKMWKNFLESESISWPEQAKKEMLFPGDLWDSKQREFKRLVMAAQGNLASLGMMRNLDTEGYQLQYPRKENRSEVRMLWRKRSSRQKRSGHRGREKPKPELMRSDTMTSTTSREDSCRRESSESYSAIMEDDSKGSSEDRTSFYSESSQAISAINYSYSEAQESVSTEASYTLSDDDDEDDDDEDEDDSCTQESDY